MKVVSRGRRAALAATGLAAAAVGRLVARLDGDDAGGATADIVREPTLVVRGSTAPPIA